MADLMEKRKEAKESKIVEEEKWALGFFIIVFHRASLIASLSEGPPRVVENCEKTQLKNFSAPEIYVVSRTR
ncbi:uncharacterized protein G2W53_034092 [Senna tora]|uniref:Uncharacterized protein n=1 Tax=Senna tora TaxID=362788 RepID=A0A834T0Q2_9FABA|nr:uncharacterized protein G2W53_034092 [Senna tora]